MQAQIVLLALYKHGNCLLDVATIVIHLYYREDYILLMGLGASMDKLGSSIQ